MYSLTKLIFGKLLWLHVQGQFDTNYEPTIDESGVQPGPKYTATQGEVWPQPLTRENRDGYLVYSPDEFQVDVDTPFCAHIEKAIERTGGKINKMYDLINRKPPTRRQSQDVAQKSDAILMVYINFEGTCEDQEYVYPLSNMTEEYELSVEEYNISLTSSSIWGVIRGLETLSQLFYIVSDDEELEVRIDKVIITDKPLYSHRGIMLDTSRHFISVSNIKILLDAMECNKMNVLHWHLVDDESFPLYIPEAPTMSMKAAYDPSLMYLEDDLKNVVTYAAERGIRVIPELDVPGHTGSWGLLKGNLLTQCYTGGLFSGFGPLKVIDERVYKLIQKLFKVILNAFPDEYLHIGGDDVYLRCWASNPQMRAFMQRRNMNAPVQLLDYFFERLLKMLPSNKTLVFWQDVLEDGANLTLVNVSHTLQIKTTTVPNPDLYEEYKKIIISSCWNVEHAKWSRGWEEFYTCDMVAKSANASVFTNNMVGGEALLVTRFVDDNNIISRAWPLLSATAERLWTAEEHIDVENLPHSRLEEHVCRMIRRGINAEPPNGHGYCLS